MPLFLLWKPASNQTPLFMVKQQKQGSASLIPAQLTNPLSQKVCGVFTLSHQNSNTLGSYYRCHIEIASKNLVRALWQHPGSEHSSAVQRWEHYPPGICSLSKEAVGFCQNKDLHISSQLSLKSGEWGTSEPHGQILGSQPLLARMPELEVSSHCYFCVFWKMLHMLHTDPLFKSLIHHLLLSPV